jgi:hypothetical protein
MRAKFSSSRKHPVRGGVRALPVGPTMPSNAAYNASRDLRDDSALQRYLDVVNRTLVEVKDRFPYNSLIGSFASTLAGRPLIVSITGASSMNETSFGCVLEGLAFRFTSVAAPMAATRWRLDREHIDAVITEPWRYLADPSRLQLPPFSLVGSPGHTPAARPPARRRHVHASKP